MREQPIFDISEHTNALCEIFGVEPRLVSSIKLYPFTAEVELSKVNEKGEKFIEEDGWVARHPPLVFRVQT